MRGLPPLVGGTLPLQGGRAISMVSARRERHVVDGRRDGRRSDM